MGYPLKEFALRPTRYDSIWGRFTTVDPGHVSGSLTDPQGWNAYAYARNNPLRYVDPDGRKYSLCIQNEGCSTLSDIEFDEQWGSQSRYDVRWHGNTGEIWNGDNAVGMVVFLGADEYDVYVVARPVENSGDLFNHISLFIVDRKSREIVRQFSVGWERNE